MRKYTIPQNMIVEYMLSDQLGSTSLTTDTNGAKVLELRYKAWGEVRASWTSAPSTTPAYRSPLYTFTGQASYMDDPTTTSATEGFGLMFYNARWYDLPLDASPRRIPSSLAECRDWIGMPTSTIRHSITWIQADMTHNVHPMKVVGRPITMEA